MRFSKNVLEQNQDVQGDLYEYMLGHMQFAARGGAGRGSAGADGGVRAAGGGAV